MWYNTWHVVYVNYHYYCYYFHVMTNRPGIDSMNSSWRQGKCTESACFHCVIADEIGWGRIRGSSEIRELMVTPRTWLQSLGHANRYIFVLFLITGFLSLSLSLFFLSYYQCHCYRVSGWGEINSFLCWTCHSRMKHVHFMSGLGI